MVYKVIGNFTDENFEKIIRKISESFKFIYYKDTLYLALKSYDSFEGHELVINKSFRPVRDFLVRKIDESNILKEPEIISDWCKDNYVKLEQQRFEREQQVKLKQVWTAMDNMESQLKAKKENLNQICEA